MSKQGYPESLDCWLKDFPRYIKVIFGPGMDLVDGPWGNGSTVLLERIGFDTPDTTPTVGVPQPNVKVTYSDNGTDSDWIFKIGFYGWGTFFATIPGTNYYILTEKFLEFESIYFSKKKFKYLEVFETQIGEGVSIPNVDIPVEIIDNPPSDPGNETEGGGSSDGTTNLDALDHSLLAWNLVRAYQGILDINNIQSIQVSKYRANSLDVTGWRQLQGTTGYNGQTVEFWTNSGTLKVTFSTVQVQCEEVDLETGWEDCTYTTFITDAFTWTSLKVNGLEKLSTLLSRA